MKHYYKKILKEDTIIKKDISSKNIWLLCFAILVFSSIISFAQTGEITGYIKDNSTDEPIPFSNVVLKGTTIGAATDIDGKYRISNVPPGSYDIIASSMGYQKVTITGVVVSSNRILEANFELTPTVISTEDVVVVAERPPVDVEVASSAKMITSKDVQNMPAVTNVKDLISLQASVVKDGENIHIRGGNANEVLYLIDGVPSKNPITGVSSVEIDINQIEEVEILTGGFDAEYGNANSGVINIITKSGRDHFTADVILQSDEPFGKSRSSNYDRAYVGVSGPFSLFNLVGLPGDAGFTISTNTTLDDQFNHNPGSFGETDLYLFNAPNRQYSHYNLTGKLNYQPIKSMRIKTDFTFQKTYNKPFAWSWKNIPEEIGVNRNSFNRFTFQLNHNLGKDAYYILNVGYEKSKYKGGKDGLNSPAQAWSFAQRYYDKVKKTYVILNTPEQLKDYMNKFPGQIDFSKSGSKYLPPTSNFDFDSDGFWDLASNRDFKRNEYEYFSAGLDYTHFFGVHKFKAGVDVNFSKVKIMEIYDYSFYFPKRDSLPGAYSEYGSSRWYFNNVPWNGSMFVQDRIEYGGMFLNLGVRGDFFVHGNIVDNTSFIEAYNEAIKIANKRMTSIILSLKPTDVHFFGNDIPNDMFGYGMEHRGWVFNEKVSYKKKSHKFKFSFNVSITKQNTKVEDDDLDSNYESTYEDNFSRNETNLANYICDYLSYCFLERHPFSLKHLKPNYKIVDTIKGFNSLIKKLRRSKVWGYDLETENLSVYGNKILTMQFTLDSEPDMAYIVFCKHKDSPFDGKELEHIYMEMHKLLSRHLDHYSWKTPIIVGQNLDFDMRVSRVEFGIPVITYRLWDCFHPDTYIDTNRGKIKISDLLTIDKPPLIKSFNHKSGEIEYKELLHVWGKQTEKEMFELEYEGGSIRVTSDHKVWCVNRDEYIEVKDLTENDEILISE